MHKNPPNYILRWDIKLKTYGNQNSKKYFNIFFFKCHCVNTGNYF